MNTAKVPKSSGRSTRQGTKVTLPTSETISRYQHLRRVQIPGFPVITEHLPVGIETEDIIKQWPNHPWGPRLLQITTHWSPKQISSLSGGILRPNSIIKRVKAAKVQAGETQQQVKFPEKGGKHLSKRTRVMDAAPQIREDGRNAEQFVIEPEASCEFCISQMEMERAVKAKDSNHELRQIGCVKKTPGLDRILIDQASDREGVSIDAIALNYQTHTVAKLEGTELVRVQLN